MHKDGAKSPISNVYDLWVAIQGQSRVVGRMAQANSQENEGEFVSSSERNLKFRPEMTRVQVGWLRVKRKNSDPIKWDSDYLLDETDERQVGQLLALGGVHVAVFTQDL